MKKYAVDYDHVFGGFGVVDTKTSLFVAHTGTETGARVKARSLNARKMYVCVYSGVGLYGVKSETGIHQAAWIWDEEVTRLIARDGENFFVIWSKEEQDWAVYA